MKKLVSIMIFLITCIFSFGNDWEFISQGEHLIPLQISDMAIKKEKIEILELFLMGDINLIIALLLILFKMK